MSKIIINPAKLNQIRCHVCKNLLSYFPIYLSKGKNICGRCPLEDGAVRCEVYEALAECYAFSCRYERQGCLQELFPNEIPTHEANCPLRLMKCSAKPGCSWYDIIPHYIPHCEEDHPEMFIKANIDFEISMTSSCKVNKFMMFNNTPLSVSWELNIQEERLKFLIRHHEEKSDQENYTFQLALKFGERIRTTEVKVGCMTDLVYSETCNKALKILKAFLSFKKTDESVQGYQSETMFYVLGTLKCLKCNKYVLPPVYTHSDGSLYCDSCAVGKDKTSLSIALTKLAESAKYPCKHATQGCDYAGFPSLIKEHLKFCEYELTKCIYNNEKKPCDWISYKEKLGDHYHHKHNVYKNGAIICVPSIVLRMNYTYSKTHLLQFEKYYFCLIISINKQILRIHVEKSMPIEKKFKFEIDFIDNNYSGDRIRMRKTANNMHRKDYYCTLSTKQIDSFLVKTEKESLNLFFSVTIFDDLGR